MKLFKGRFEILDDLRGNDVRWGQVVGVLEGLVPRPEDVEVELVAGYEGFVVEAAEALGLFAPAAVACVVAGDEVVEVAAPERVLLEREVLVGMQVADPETLVQESRLAGFLSKKSTSALAPRL